MTSKVINETKILSNFSQRFSEFGNFIARGDSTKVFAEIGYLTRQNDSIKNNIICDYEISILVPTDLSLFDSFDIPIDHQEYIFSAFSALTHV